MEAAMNLSEETIRIHGVITRLESMGCWLMAAEFRKLFFGDAK